MTARRIRPAALATSLCLLVAACGGEETAGADPREALMRFCEASDGGEACDCGVDLMLEAFDEPSLAVLATLANAAGDDADPGNLLQDMVEGGDLEPEAAQTIVTTMTEVARRITEECAE